MKKENRVTEKQALQAALRYAGLQDAQWQCRLNRLEEGLYRILLRTPYLAWEFYVDADSGEVLGIDTEPIPYPEMPGSEGLPAAA